MATELDGGGELICQEHGGQVVHTYGSNGDLRWVKLRCECTLEFNFLKVGDAVLCEGELFRVDHVLEGDMYDDVFLKNNETSFYTQSCAVQYIGRDTLSPQAILPMSTFVEPSRPNRYFPGNDSKPKKKPSTRKTHAISTADLIKSEVQNLEQRRPTGELAESVVEQTPDTTEAPTELGPIPRRDGDWE